MKPHVYSAYILAREGVNLESEGKIFDVEQSQIHLPPNMRTIDI